MSESTNIKKLVSIGSEPLSSSRVDVDALNAATHGELAKDLQMLLTRKNGFFAFESALHIFPEDSLATGLTLRRWNSGDLWRYEYGDLSANKLFFAEDAFGNQFCLAEGGICSFDAETGSLETLGTNLEEWAERILDDYEVYTGYHLLREWQLKYGPIPVGHRLMPKRPFVLGGLFEIDNLYSISAAQGMKSRGNLARQIRDLPDGASIEFRIAD